MIKVDDCLVSEDVIEKSFACNVEACKGVCCIEGDAGAPIEPSEIDVIRQNIEQIKDEMDDVGIETLNSRGFSEKDPFDQMLVTTCKPNKECVFVVRKNGILNCAIELANQKKSFDFQKPISCHLYPIRVDKYKEFYALNYHRWSICADACTKGEKEDIKVYQFAQNALERKFGKEWYKNLKKTIQEYLVKK
tara:strand:- start:6267 stop:6842 length:576 start_codon:yes stop_codon:yes gene_type:complete